MTAPQPPLPAPGARVRKAEVLRDTPAPAMSADGLIARAVEAEARFICETLRLFHFCPRAACRKSRRCRGLSRLCLDLRGALAPAEAHEWAEALLEAGRTGETREQVEGANSEALLAFESWTAGLEAKRG